MNILMPLISPFEIALAFVVAPVAGTVKGVMRAQTLPFSAVLVVPAPIGMWLGAKNPEPD